MWEVLVGIEQLEVRDIAIPTIYGTASPNKLITKYKMSVVLNLRNSTLDRFLFQSIFPVSGLKTLRIT